MGEESRVPSEEQYLYSLLRFGVGRLSHVLPCMSINIGRYSRLNWHLCSRSPCTYLPYLVVGIRYIKHDCPALPHSRYSLRARGTCSGKVLGSGVILLGNTILRACKHLAADAQEIRRVGVVVYRYIRGGVSSRFPIGVFFSSLRNRALLNSISV